MASEAPTPLSLPRRTIVRLPSLNKGAPTLTAPLPPPPTSSHDEVNEKEERKKTADRVALHELLDPSQLAVVCYPLHSPLLVEAGPGSGKTHTLVHRLARLLAQPSVEASSVLVLCFSRKAADTLRVRLQEVMTRFYATPASASSGPPRAAGWQRCRIKTLHAFGLECLRRFGVIDAETEILMPSKQLQLAHRLIRAQARSDDLTSSEIAESVEDFLDYIHLQKRTVSTRKSPPNAEDDTRQCGYAFMYPSAAQRFGHLAELYQKALTEEYNAVDYDDLQYKLYLLLRPPNESPAEASPQSLSAAQLQSEIQYVFVDEFQDLNEVQLEIVAQLVGQHPETGEARASVTCVGDPYQCIFGWRGALDNIFSLWEKRFRTTQRRVLTVNYRSTPSLVRLFNRFMKRDQHSSLEGEEGKEGGIAKCIECRCASNDPLPIHPKDQKEEASPLVPSLFTFSEASLQVTRHLIEQMLRGPSSLVFEDIAVLCRTKRQVAEVSEHLEQHKIPIRLLKSQQEDYDTMGGGNNKKETPLSKAFLYLSYLRCCFAYPSNADVRTILSKTLRLTIPRQQRFFFDLEATAATVNRDHTQPSLDPEVPVSEYFAVNKPSAVSSSFYSILLQLVYHQFDSEKYPKIKLSRPNQKIVMKFIQCTTHARDLLYTTVIPTPLNQGDESSVKSALHSGFSIIKQTAEYILAETGLDGSSEMGSRSKPAARRKPVERRAEDFTASLLAEVAQAFHHQEDTSTKESKKPKKEMENEGELEEAVPLTSTLFELCEAVETVMLSEYGSSAVKPEGPPLPPPGPPLLMSRVLDEYAQFLAGLEEADDECGDAAREKQTKDRRRGRVSLGTVHSAKGLEWAAVILPFCCDKMFPVSKHPEERRVFYVALTRAKEHLFLLTSSEPRPSECEAVESRKHSRNGTPLSMATSQPPAALAVTLPPSPFLREIGEFVEMISWDRFYKERLDMSE